jgi:MFS family permease
MKKNLFIYITAFFCGMSIMAVELSASRLLAPYFGTSSIIWTIIIGLIMVLLSVGNVLGGRSADKYNSMDRLYALIWLAAAWIAIIPLIGKYIITFSVFILMWVLPDHLLTAGSAFSCLVIFSFPLVILGMVSPYLVKLGVSSMEDNGKTTGKIYAMSNIGSIIGTFIPTFLTIPYIGTSKTFLVFSLVLNIICL